MKPVKWRQFALCMLLGVAGMILMPEGPFWREILSAVLIALATIIWMDAETTP